MTTIHNGDLEIFDISELDEQSITNLASAVIKLTGMSEGNNLVCAIGTGDEPNNFEALYYWILNQKELYFSHNPLTIVQQLLERFNSKINEFMYMSFQDY